MCVAVCVVVAATHALAIDDAIAMTVFVLCGFVVVLVVAAAALVVVTVGCRCFGGNRGFVVCGLGDVGVSVTVVLVGFCYSC